MNFIDRANLLNTRDFYNRCKIAICDWINYWVNAGTDSIEDEILREQTSTFCKFALANLDHYVNKITALVISQENIKNLQEVTDTDILTAVNGIMSNGIDSLL